MKTHTAAMGQVAPASQVGYLSRVTLNFLTGRPQYGRSPSKTMEEGVFFSLLFITSWAIWFLIKEAAEDKETDLWDRRAVTSWFLARCIDSCQELRSCTRGPGRLKDLNSFLSPQEEFLGMKPLLRSCWHPTAAFLMSQHVFVLSRFHKY